MRAEEYQDGGDTNFERRRQRPAARDTDTSGGSRPGQSPREGEEHPVASGRQRFSIISDGLPTQLPDIDPDETR
ncbi:MAG TPA: hypothetical protein VH307_24355, partial [Streptosporangiaceae bacterium]|nr:hypothetical protein [Streptosporangiaceae bacterium]